MTKPPRFILTIDTSDDRFHPDDSSGPVLAAVIREVADHVEDSIQILPQRQEWNTETYAIAPGVSYRIVGGQS